MMDVRKHRRVDIVGTEEKAMKLAADPTFRSFNVFTDNLFSVERYKSSVKLDKPIYTGISVLDVSKLFMYQYHYDYVKVKYPGTKSKLCFTDTDSFLYILQSDDIYADMLENHQEFDFSGYPNSHKMFRGLAKDDIEHLKKKNKKVLNKMKDELNGNPMLEFVAPRVKVYSFTYEKEVFVDANGNEVDEENAVETKTVISNEKKLKGIKKCVVKRNINHEDYKSTVFAGTKLYKTMTTFRSLNHQVCTIEQNKLALSCFDDKRYILDDGVSTLAHGHWRTL